MINANLISFKYYNFINELIDDNEWKKGKSRECFPFLLLKRPKSTKCFFLCFSTFGRKNL